MSSLTRPKPVKFFLAALFAPDAPMAALERRLRLEIGEIEAALAPIPFSHSDYYEAEMGRDLQKTIWLFTPEITPDMLPAFKVHFTRVEQDFSRAEGQGRVVNLDPGWMDLARVILATGKDRAHRIHLSKGVYAETTLMYHKGAGFEPMPWTYTDYAKPATREFFNAARERLRIRRGSDA